jgi:hypothetical protein
MTLTSLSDLSTDTGSFTGLAMSRLVLASRLYRAFCAIRVDIFDFGIS